VGWELTGNAGTPQPDYEERAILAYIVYLREGCRLSWRKVSDAVEARLSAKENRKPAPRYEGDSARRFGFMRCRRPYNVAKEIGLEPESTF